MEEKHSGVYMVKINDLRKDEPTISRETLDEYIRDVRELCSKGVSVTHKLKILPQYFIPVMLGEKTFELRKNDRNYKVGDTIELCEYENGEYTGRYERAIVTYVLKDCTEYGLDKDYCILSFRLCGGAF